MKRVVSRVLEVDAIASKMLLQPSYFLYVLKFLPFLSVLR